MPSGGKSRLMMHASLRRQLLHLATDQAELVENPSDLPQVFDLLIRRYTTPAAEAARAALRADPDSSRLVAERCWGCGRRRRSCLTLPAESLGHRYASWFANAGGQPLPIRCWRRAPTATTPGCSSCCVALMTCCIW